MSQVLTLKLPEGTSVESGKTLEAEIKVITGVKSAGIQQTRDSMPPPSPFGSVWPILSWTSSRKSSTSFAARV